MRTNRMSIPERPSDIRFEKPGRSGVCNVLLPNTSGMSPIRGIDAILQFLISGVGIMDDRSKIIAGCRRCYDSPVRIALIHAFGSFEVDPYNPLR